MCVRLVNRNTFITRESQATSQLHDAILLVVTVFDHTVADQLATLLQPRWPG
jgi:hypothetical protein